MPPDSKSRWSVLHGIGLLIGLAVLVLFLEAVSFLFVGEAPSSRSPGPVSVTIVPGASVAEIGRVLHQAGLVSHPRAFELATRLLRADEQLQAGQVTLSPGLPICDLVHRLTRVRATGVRVVVREGLMATQVAELLESAAGIDADDFLNAVYDTAFAESLGFSGVSLEGYLFPDTYMFYRNMSGRRAAMRMAWNFKRKVPDSMFEEGAGRNLDRHEVVTLASILQWEVLRRDEWRTVSSVYHNRLRRNMLLQADPTINYIQGRGPTRLTLQDLDMESPYNTYIHKGLPPGPINSPGLRAIRAALSPDNTDYLFFVARGDGSHIFSRTAEEHFRAKAEASEARRRQALEDTTQQG
jgi:UPF0755 protein